MHISWRVVAALVTIVTVLLWQQGSAFGHNWGAGDQGPRCVEANPDTDCTPADGRNYVYIDSDIPYDLEVALTNSLVYDYDIIDGPTEGVEGIRYYALDAATDVRVRYSVLQAGDPWAYTTCQSGATYGDGQGFYRYCRKMLVRFDPNANRMQNCLQNLGCLAFIACHELGHTYGISHAAAARHTCTNYEDWYDLDDHDKQHLVYCFEKPVPAPFDLTPVCRDYV